MKVDTNRTRRYLGQYSYPGQGKLAGQQQGPFELFIEQSPAGPVMIARGMNVVRSGLVSHFALAVDRHPIESLGFDPCWYTLITLAVQHGWLRTKGRVTYER